MDGIAQATQNIVQGFSGALSDKLQRRKPVALAGYLLAAVAKPLMGLATVWQGVFGARLLDRLGAGTRSAPRDALIASSVEEKDRGRAFGLEGIGDNAGAFLGPLLAVFLLYVAAYWHTRHLLSGADSGSLAFLMVLLVKERPVAVAAKAKIDISLRQFPKTYWRYLLATALFGIGNSSNAFLILRTQDIGASLETTILIYAGVQSGGSVDFLSGGVPFRQMGPEKHPARLVPYFPSSPISALPSRKTVLLIAALFVFYGMYQGIFRAVGKALASDFVPEHLRASGIGWYSTTVGLLQLVASVVAGLLWDRIGHGGVFSMVRSSRSSAALGCSCWFPPTEAIQAAKGRLQRGA